MQILAQKMSLLKVASEEARYLIHFLCDYSPLHRLIDIVLETAPVVDGHLFRILVAL